MATVIESTICVQLVIQVIQNLLLNMCWLEKVQKLKDLTTEKAVTRILHHKQ